MESKEEEYVNEVKPAAENKDPKFCCRFYENGYPEKNEVVMVRYKELEEHCAKVELLEYNNIEGMILASEITRKRTSQVMRHLRIGKKEPSVVITIDPIKGFMDLSKIKVRGEDAPLCEEKYRKAKTVHSILQRTAINCDVPLEVLYKEIIWPLKMNPTTLLALFKSIAQTSSYEGMFKHVTIKEEIGKELFRQCQVKLSSHAIRIKADFEVTCFTFEGIDAIKEALKEGMEAGTFAPGEEGAFPAEESKEAEKEETKEEKKEEGKKEETKEGKEEEKKEGKEEEKHEEAGGVKIYLVAPPLYECVIQTKEKSRGIELINRALKRVEEVIKSKKGSFMKKSEPRVIGGDRDESEDSDSIGNFDQQQIDSSDEEEGIDIDVSMPSKGDSEQPEDEKTS